MEECRDDVTGAALKAASIAIPRVPAKLVRQNAMRNIFAGTPGEAKFQLRLPKDANKALG